MSEKYTPDETELANCYAHVLEDRAGEDYDQAKADAERGIAKIKADALREFADQQAKALAAHGHLLDVGAIEDSGAWIDSIRIRAKRIEQEASND